jgi:hypothetical protein
VRRLTLVLLAVAAAPLHGQSRLASACAAALAAARSGEVTVDALDWLPVCRESGAEALTQLWERGGARSPAVQRTLRYRSQDVRDERVYRAVVAAARDTARPTSERLDALIVLLSHFDSSTAIDSAWLATTGDFAMLPRIIHPKTTAPWLQPLPEARLAEIPALLRQLAVHEQDPGVRDAARRLRKAMALSYAQHTPIDADAVTLSAGCASRVVLSSTADVFVGVELAVEGTEFRRKYALGAAAPGRPTTRLLSFPPGIVVATRNGEIVARLTERQAPCAESQTRTP